ncbi:MAG: biotin/lipoyl-containing protein [Thermoleophilaceae bacterium]
MPGTVLRVEVEAGEEVSEGQRLVVLEAMKMELSVAAPFDGVVERVEVAAGDRVPVRALLAAVEPHRR